MDRFIIRKKRSSCGELDDLKKRKKPHNKSQEKEIKEEGRKVKEEEEEEERKNLNVAIESESNAVANKSQAPLSECLYKGIVDLGFPNLTSSSSLTWRKIQRENLDLDYAPLFPRKVADALVRVLEEELQYFTGDLARVQIFGKWHQIPRKQATYGDSGLTYRYSGIVTPAQPWPRPLEVIRDLLARVTGHTFNFVLVNRYKDGSDRMGEHKDDEKELDRLTPIASVSLGQARDFYFKHQDSRAPNKTRNVDKVNLVLENGSLLLMNPPTNSYWYHALPPRKKSAPGVRINLTFRKIIRK